MKNVVSNLWFEKEAREAVEFYVSLVPNSAITRIATLPAESPSGPPDSVKIIEFTLGKQEFLALEAGPLDPFNHSFSIMIQCDTQEEIDRLWNAILENGGEPEQCGWIRDRWGLCWQIAPRDRHALADGLQPVRFDEAVELPTTSSARSDDAHQSHTAAASCRSRAAGRFVGTERGWYGMTRQTARPVLRRYPDLHIGSGRRARRSPRRSARWTSYTAHPCHRGILESVLRCRSAKFHRGHAAIRE